MNIALDVVSVKGYALMKIIFDSVLLLLSRMVC